MINFNGCRYEDEKQAIEMVFFIPRLPGVSPGNAVTRSGLRGCSKSRLLYTESHPTAWMYFSVCGLVGLGTAFLFILVTQCRGSHGSLCVGWDRMASESVDILKRIDHIICHGVVPGDASRTHSYGKLVNQWILGTHPYLAIL